jgi:hypothetical protein
MRPQIKEAFEAVNYQPPKNPFESEKTRARREKFSLAMRIKEVEMVLMALLERDLEDMTVQELYNEIVGEASDT